MYTLYYLPDACSLATQVVLHELGEDVDIINIQQLSDFTAINPVGSVPVLIDGDSTLREGAAILLHLLNKHQSHMLPNSGASREQAIQDILFANATTHPAYSRLFFIAQNINNDNARQVAFTAAAEAINKLWLVVEQQLAGQVFLGGDRPSAADIMLAVYSRWGASFPVTIAQGSNTARMLAAVQALPSFLRAIAAESLDASSPSALHPRRAAILRNRPLPHPTSSSDPTLRRLSMRRARRWHRASMATSRARPSTLPGCRYAKVV